MALLLSAVGLLVSETSAACDHYDYHLSGKVDEGFESQTEGGLMLMGGGGLVDEAFRWFLKKAGGGRIVVLSAYDGKSATGETLTSTPKTPFDYGKYLLETLGGCESVERIVFKHRLASSDPEVLKVIRQADGIFLGGGAQWRYADFWKGTPVAEAMDAHVRAGRPLGGSSAGLAVLGDWCYTAHLSARVTGEIALNDPQDPRLTFEPDLLHFDILRGVITDTHFSNRKREGRLMTFLARFSIAEPAAPLVGIGVDEKTALCLEADGRGRVMTTAAEGRAWLYVPKQAPEPMVAGKPLKFGGVEVLGIGLESLVDLPKRTVERPAIERVVSAANGKLVWKEGKP